MNLEADFGPVIDAMTHEQRLALLPEGCMVRRLMERKGGRDAYRGHLVRDELLRALYREQQQGQPVAVEVEYPPMWEPEELPEEF